MKYNSFLLSTTRTRVFQINETTLGRLLISPPTPSTVTTVTEQIRLKGLLSLTTSFSGLRQGIRGRALSARRPSAALQLLSRLTALLALSFRSWDWKKAFFFRHPPYFILKLFIFLIPSFILTIRTSSLRRMAKLRKKSLLRP